MLTLSYQLQKFVKEFNICYKPRFYILLIPAINPNALFFFGGDRFLKLLTSFNSSGDKFSSQKSFMINEISVLSSR